MSMESKLDHMSQLWGYEGHQAETPLELQKNSPSLPHKRPLKHANSQR